GAALAATVSTHFDLAALEGKLQRELGRPADSTAAYERARDIAEDDAHRCVAWIGIAAGHRMTSTIEAGFAALDRAASLAERADLVRERARIHQLRGNLNFTHGDVASCRAEHERSLALAQQVNDAEAEAQALSGIADAMYAQGLLRSAHATF